MRRIVITGLGIIAPNGIGKEEFWTNAEEGRSYVERDPEMVSLGIKSTVLCRMRNFDPAAFFEHEMLSEDRFVQIGLAAGMMAVEDAGLGAGEQDRERIGCIYSTAVGGTPTVAATWERLTDSGRVPLCYHPVGPTFSHATCSNYPGALVMKKFGFRGVSTALSTGCTAGLDTLGLCFELIRTGDADVMVAGASEAPLANISYATLDAIGSLSVADCPPNQASRPFDLKRAGFVLAEGATAVVLEELDHALARGAHVYAEVLAFDSVSNARHMTDLPEDGMPMARLIQRTLKMAKIDPSEIQYINAHGSSTPQNDVFETNAFKHVFGEHAFEIPISSTKSMIGHSLSAASLTGVIAAIGAIERSVIPPTANLEISDPVCDLDYVAKIKRLASVGAALVTASEFGGIHSAAIFRAYDA